MGISESDIKELASCVSIIFHCAANVRFDQHLKGALNMNTQGTLRAMTVAENFKRLDVSLIGIFRITNLKIYLLINFRPLCTSPPHIANATKQFWRRGDIHHPTILSR